MPTSLRTRDGWADYFEAQRPDEPHLHQIEPTNHCPYACIMCPRSQHMTRRRGFMEMALYRQVIDEVATFSEPVRSKEIELFHFGESLLHPEIVEMVAYASERRLNITLSVNAPELKPDLARALLERHPYRLIVSLDGYDDASYRRIRGPAADFGLARANIEHLRRLWKRVGAPTEVVIRMIALRANRDRLLPFKWEWERRGIPVDIRTFFPWGEPSMVELGDFGAYPPAMPCPFPWQHLVVQWNGDVVPCCRDYNGRLRLGTVRESTLREIWQGEGYQRLRRQMRSGDYGDNDVCRQCMSIYFTEPADGAPAEAGAPCNGPIGGDADLLPPDVAVVSGRADRGEDLAALWRDAVLSHADRIYLVDDGLDARLSFGEAGRIVDRVVARLVESGVGEGDRVAICCPAHSEIFLLFWATVSLGAVVVPVDPALPLQRAARLLEQVSPTLALVDGGRSTALAGVADTVIASDTAGPAPGPCPSFAEWLEQGAEATRGVDPPRGLALRPAVILFTSGTTGRPKGVQLSHKALANSGRLVADVFGWRPGDVLLSPGELHTMSGLRNPVVAAALAGAAAIVAPEETRGSAVGLIECADRCRATLLAGVPAMLDQMTMVADRCVPNALSTLRGTWVTGAFLEPAVRAGFEGRFGVPVGVYFGLTETAGFCAGELEGKPRVDPPAIGHPVEAIFGIFGDDGRPADSGSVGELWIQSPNLMLGYLDDEEASHRAFHGPWFCTGDLARVRADGGYEVIGRRGDVIKGPHGEIVSAREVELALRELPDVRDAAACVLAEPGGDGSLHAAVVPVVEPASPEIQSGWLAGLRELLLERLGSKRMPASLTVCSEIPRGPSGDVRRDALREMVSHGE